jgi:hypothetical protein
MFTAFLQRMMRTGFRRGMAGSRGWLYVGIAAGGVRLLRRIAHDKEEVLYRTAVKPGDVFEIITSARGK